MVVGAGFAGLAAAQALPGWLDVTVIDPGEWFEFLPNVHEVVSAVKQPADIRLDNGNIRRRRGWNDPERSSANKSSTRLFGTGVDPLHSIRRIG